MMITIKNVQENVTESEHGAYLEKCVSYSYFQTSDWISVLTATYPNYKNATCLVQLSDGTTALLPLVRVKKIKGLVTTYHSMPFHTYGGVVNQEPMTDEKMQVVLEYLFTKKWIKLSITPDPLKDSFKSKVQGPKLKSIMMKTQILRLDKGYDWLWENRFDSKNRNQIRKARKSGLVVAENLPNSGKLYSQMYHETIKSRKGKGLVYPETLFVELAKSPEKVKYYFAFGNEKPVGAILVVYGKKAAMYWSAVVLPEGKTLCANQLLLDHAIQNAVLAEVAVFDFGASKGLPAVRQFKSAFGPEEISYNIWEFTKYVPR